ncbi:MAG: hypothetical protein ACJ762_08110 [Solirubrobacteraceae bacterium]
MNDRGQASVEWIALIGVVALLFTAATLAAGPYLSAHGRRIPPSEGAALALARRWAPALVLERGTTGVPVDPRTCRAVACSIGATPVLFTHVLHRGTTTYVQYWAYWPESSWHGVAGRHADDWESFQVRIDPDGIAWARASAHHGYTGRRIGPDLNVNQVRPQWVPERWRRGWTRYANGYAIAKNSHAGYVSSSFAALGPAPRLVPLDPATLPGLYAIAPPWRKAVYSEPESAAT